MEIDLHERKTRQPKRKAEEEEKPAKKKRKYDLLDNWGNDEDDSDDKEDNLLVNWLVESAPEARVDNNTEVDKEPVTGAISSDRYRALLRDMQKSFFLLLFLFKKAFACPILLARVF